VKLLKAHWLYLKHVIYHKRLVFQEARRLGLPLWIALLHDWSKLLPSEWFPYVDYLNRMGEFPHAKDVHAGALAGLGIFPKTKESVKEAFLAACYLHYQRNKHHWNHYVKDGLAEPMPEIYRREMLADWWAVARALGDESPLAWYLYSYYKINLHRDTRLWVDRQLMGMPDMIGTLEDIANMHNGDVLLMKQSFLDDAKNFKAGVGA
jgi:hypothetical protein